MNLAKSPGPLTQRLVVLAFVGAFVASFGYFWVKYGGELPDGQDDTYQVSFRTHDVKNLQELGDVSIAGVVIGRVDRREPAGDKTRVVLNLDRETPLHQGATVRIGVKGLVGTSYVDIVDGKGPPIPDGTTLPDSSVKPAVDIDEVINTLGPKTRANLRSAVRSLGEATGGTARDTNRLMQGLGMLGRSGHTVLDALASQSRDLQALTREATTLMDTVNTTRGRIAHVVRDAATLTDATAGQREAIESTVRSLPRVLGQARTATDKVSELSGALAPVAKDLNQAAPHLNQALLQLPSVSDDLRGLVPDLDRTLDRAPATLNRVPAFASDVRGLIPGAETMLRDVNPMLAYLRPYGRDIGSMFASFGASMDMVAENGVRPIRLAPVFDTGTVRGLPVPTTADPLTWANPYPKPGTADDPAPYRGEYPRVKREPK